MDSQALVPQSSAALATRFGPYQRLSVRQRKKWLEILLSFELKNSYDVYDERQLEALATLKSKDELLGDVVTLLLSPIQNVLGALNAPGATLAGAVQTLAERSE